ncbi:hypothetical protein HN018_26740 (plasmid) [Lichenicola cladoniae]|uniref:Uncharacterized protein n=1 Tax=Lichenicola cladoniae TaxID=1484109 RepID=A0A6M8I0H3_9PROT|nr:hypothetical protein [Lichenicola cladoniae]NPD66619.1 hypothetical protein [Acetobacteraceae bacterium]QKE93731.1 hypothetical protein HN018_26740 [Lichenicola cladoniae]
MSYQTRHPEAAAHPLRSIPMFRPASVLGTAFMAKQDPLTLARQAAARTLELAQYAIAEAWEAYGAAKAAVGEVNRMGRKNRHDRAISSDRYVARRRSEAFGTMNRRRGHFLRAHKALFAAEAALLALAN